MGPKRVIAKAVATVAAELSKSVAPSTSVIVDDDAKKKKRGRPKKTSASDNAVGSDDGTSQYFKPKPTKSRLLLLPSSENKLPKSFYDLDTISLSKALLGKVLCRKLPGSGQIVRGTIVETEAYPGVGDAASKSFKGEPTPSTVAMFMDPGTAYVYMTYGMYYCLNITSSSNDSGGACLLRGLEVHEDYEIMQELRGGNKKQKLDEEEGASPAKRFKIHELANGPSKLCLSFNITRDLCDKIDLSASNDLWLENSTDEKYLNGEFEIEESRRVGIDSTPPEARNKLYRFFVKDNASVSKASFKTTKSKGGKSKRRGRPKKKTR